MTCPHPAAEPVEVDGIDQPGTVTVVAWLCTTCLASVSPGEVGDRCWYCDWVSYRRLGDREPVLVLARPCAAHREWQP